MSISQRMKKFDPYSTPARRRRIIADLAKTVLRGWYIRGCDNVHRFRTETSASIRMQCFVRQSMARHRLTVLRVQYRLQAALKMQSIYRMHRAVELKKCLRAEKILRQQKRLVCVVEHLWAIRKAKLYRAALLVARQIAREKKRNLAALMIQRFYRGYVARKLFQHRRYHQKLVFRRRHVAAIVIQKTVRRWSCQHRYLRLRKWHKAAHKITSLFIRHHLLMKHLRKKRGIAALKVQCWYRRILAIRLRKRLVQERLLRIPRIEIQRNPLEIQVELSTKALYLFSSRPVHVFLQWCLQQCLVQYSPQLGYHPGSVVKQVISSVSKVQKEQQLQQVPPQKTVDIKVDAWDYSSNSKDKNTNGDDISDIPADTAAISNAAIYHSSPPMPENWDEPIIATIDVPMINEKENSDRTTAKHKNKNNTPASKNSTSSSHSNDNSNSNSNTDNNTVKKSIGDELRCSKSVSAVAVSTNTVYGAPTSLLDCLLQLQIRSLPVTVGRNDTLKPPVIYQTIQETTIRFVPATWTMSASMEAFIADDIAQHPGGVHHLHEQTKNITNDNNHGHDNDNKTDGNDNEDDAVLVLEDAVFRFQNAIVYVPVKPPPPKPTTPAAEQRPLPPPPLQENNIAFEDSDSSDDEDALSEIRNVNAFSSIEKEDSSTIEEVVTAIRIHLSTPSPPPAPVLSPTPSPPKPPPVNYGHMARRIQKRYLKRHRQRVAAAKVIQSLQHRYWRLERWRNLVFDYWEQCFDASVVIQCAYRQYRARKALARLKYERDEWYFPFGHDFSQSDERENWRAFGMVLPDLSLSSSSSSSASKMFSSSLEEFCAPSHFLSLTEMSPVNCPILMPALSMTSLSTAATATANRNNRSSNSNSSNNHNVNKVTTSSSIANNNGSVCDLNLTHPPVCQLVHKLAVPDMPPNCLFPATWTNTFLYSEPTTAAAAAAAPVAGTDTTATNRSNDGKTKKAGNGNDNSDNENGDEDEKDLLLQQTEMSAYESMIITHFLSGPSSLVASSFIPDEVDEDKDQDSVESFTTSITTAGLRNNTSVKDAHVLQDQNSYRFQKLRHQVHIRRWQRACWGTPARRISTRTAIKGKEEKEEEERKAVKEEKKMEIKQEIEGKKEKKADDVMVNASSVPLEGKEEKEKGSTKGKKKKKSIVHDGTTFPPGTVNATALQENQADNKRLQENKKKTQEGSLHSKNDETKQQEVVPAAADDKTPPQLPPAENKEQSEEAEEEAEEDLLDAVERSMFTASSQSSNVYVNEQESESSAPQQIKSTRMKMRMMMDEALYVFSGWLDGSVIDEDGTEHSLLPFSTTNNHHHYPNNNTSNSNNSASVSAASASASVASIVPLFPPSFCDTNTADMKTYTTAGTAAVVQSAVSSSRPLTGKLRPEQRSHHILQPKTTAGHNSNSTNNSSDSSIIAQKLKRLRWMSLTSNHHSSNTINHHDNDLKDDDESEDEGEEENEEDEEDSGRSKQQQKKQQRRSMRSIAALQRAHLLTPVYNSLAQHAV